MAPLDLGTDRTWVPRVALAILILSGLVRGAVTVRGYFYIDDFAFMGMSMKHSLFDPDYLTATYNSHVMPGAFGWVWLTTRLFPLQWWPVAGVIVALQLLLTRGVTVLLRNTFGWHPLILIPIALVALSPISLPGEVWWAAALNQLPQQLALVGMLLMLMAYLRTGRASFAVASAGALAGGLLFSEKTLLAVPFVVGLLAAWFVSGNAWQRSRRLASAFLPLWMAYLVVVVPYAAAYVVLVPTPVRALDAPGHDIVGLALASLFQGLAPALIGGPYRWEPVGFAGGLADPNALVVVLALVIVGATVALTTWLSRRAWRGWVLLALYVTVNLVLLTFSRATVIGPVIGREFRYQTELALVVGLILAWVLLPPRGAWHYPPVDAPTPRPGAHERLQTLVITPLRHVGVLGTSAPSSAVALVALALFVPGAVWSHARYDALWSPNPARPWVTTAHASVDAIPTGAALGTSFVPEYVAWGFIYPYNATTSVLSPVLPASATLENGEVTTTLLALDADGDLRQGGVAGTQAAPGPVAGCGWRLGTTETTIPLALPAELLAPVLRIGYLSDTATSLPLSIDGWDITVPVAAGVGAAFVSVPATARSVTFHPAAPSATVCTDDLTIGAAVPLAGTVP